VKAILEFLKKASLKHEKMMIFRKTYPIAKVRAVLFCLFLLFGFSSQAQFQINGSAAVIGTDSFQLTPALPWSNGAVWYQIRHHLDSSFSVNGKMYFGNLETGADGIVFVMQDNCLSAGAAGGGMGYENMPGNSIGVEFDTYENTTIGDPAADHIALHQMGNINHNLPNNLAGPVQMHATQTDIEDGNWYDFQVLYEPSSMILSVFFDGALRLSQAIDLKNTVFAGDPYVYWGFTSATGGSFAPNSVYIQDASFAIENDTICGGSTTLTLPPLPPLNIAENQTSNSSSNFSGGSGPPESDLPFDGNLASRWVSQFSDPQWLSVDLGTPKDIDSVILHWETAYGLEYKIQTSTDNITWTDQFYETAGNGGVDPIVFSASNVRYVRMYGIQRGTVYGYSLWEFEVYGTAEYAWSPNNGSIDDTTSSTPTFTPLATTAYTLFIPDACYGTVAFDYTVVVNSPPDASITPVSDVCLNGNPITLLPTTLGGTFSGPGINGTQFDPSLAGVGTHTIGYSVSNGSNCSSSDSVQITVVSTPTPTISGGTSCAGEPIEMIASGAIGTIYWYATQNGSSPIDSGALFQPATSGTYYVEQVVNGCPSDRIPVVAVFHNLQANAVANPSSGTAPVDIDFTNLSTGWLPVDQIVWNFGDGGSSANENPTHTYTQPGTYSVMMVVTTADGACSDTIWLTIVVENIFELSIPNVFSPNSDGQNDLFTITTEGVTDMQVSIYNRWGKDIYSWTTPQGNWDGKHKTGFEAPEGTYFYVVKAEDVLGEQHEFSGSFTLFR